MTDTWWWGTYPEAGLGSPTGRGEGLWAMTPGGSASPALELPAPSFLVGHPDLPLLYAVTEEAEATVVCVDAADRTRPEILDRIPTGGADACHVLLARDTLTLYVSHYTSGEIAVVPLRADGRLAVDAPSQVFANEGSGPNPARQEGPHAHFAGYAPTGPVLLSTDLGTDELRRFDVLPDGSLRPDGVAAALPPGSGPRHFAVRGEHLYVVCELDHALRTYHWDSGRREARLVDEAPTTHVPVRSGETAYDAHVAIVSGVALVSVRGCDVISVFDLGGDGVPTLRGSFDSGGAFPRHFTVAGERLVVGNEKSHLVATFDLADVLALDPGDDPAVPVELPHAEAEVTSPACVAVT